MNTTNTSKHIDDWFIFDWSSLLFNKSIFMHWKWQSVAESELSEDQTGHWVQSFHRGVLDNQNYQNLLRHKEGGEIRMWNMWGWELNSKGLALPWPSECVEKEARREQVVSWVGTRAGKILHLCSAQHQSCPHASVFKSYSYAPICLTSLSSDAVFVVQVLLDCLTVHQSASIVLHCIKESTPFILGWLHSIEIPRVGLAL